MTRYLLILLAGVAACDPSGATEPAENLPAVEPGITLPFPAPEDDGLFPQVAWGANSQHIVLPDASGNATTRLVRFALESGVTTTLATLSDPVQMLAAGGDAFLYTQSLAKATVLSRIGGAAVASVTAVQFAISRNGRWVVVRDSGWVMIDLATGAQRPIPDIPEFRFPLAIDSAGTQVAFGLVGQLSELDMTVTLADMNTGATRAIAVPGERLLAAAFAGERLMLLAFASAAGPDGSSVRFVTRTDLANSTRVIGSVAVSNRDGFIGACGAWSPDAGSGVGVIRTGISRLGRAQHAIVKLDSAAHIIGTANLMAPTDCTLSPDGKWFVYGNAAGYMQSGDLYLKRLR